MTSYGCHGLANLNFHICSCTLSATSKSITCSLSPLVSYPKTSTFRFSWCFPLLGPAYFCQWSGLKNMGISISPKHLKLEKRGRHKGKVVHASLFGVGAPEALVIGVVALMVFGPKGLAEVARNLGKTLREFQPTIREIQEVTREFRSTLEREITPVQFVTLNADGTPSVTEAYTSEGYLKATEEPLKASTSQQPDQMASPGENQL